MYIWLLTHIRNLILKFVNLKSSINHELLIFYAILKDKIIHNNLKHNIIESFFENTKEKSLIIEKQPKGLFWSNRFFLEKKLLLHER